MPTKDTIRKILVMKIKNSSVYFNFPMEIQVFESTNNNAMGWECMIWLMFKYKKFLTLRFFYQLIDRFLDKIIFLWIGNLYQMKVKN